jgi:hypothetical protein
MLRGAGPQALHGVPDETLLTAKSIVRLRHVNDEVVKVSRRRFIGFGILGIAATSIVGAIGTAVMG